MKVGKMFSGILGKIKVEMLLFGTRCVALVEDKMSEGRLR